MQLKLVQQYFGQFRDYLGTEAATRYLHLYESQRVFQENWDLEATDLAAMYGASLQNSVTRRLWKREHYEPREMMLRFCRMQADYVRYMFKDLFNEEKALDGRADRFVFYCDQLLEEYQSRHPRSAESDHFHRDDYQMISAYLAFRFPELYSLYDFAVFRATLEKLGVADLPNTNDLERFAKVTRTLYKLMSKDEELLEAHRRRLDPAQHYRGESLLLVFDFYLFCSGKRAFFD